MTGLAHRGSQRYPHGSMENTAKSSIAIYGQAISDPLFLLHNDQSLHWFPPPPLPLCVLPLYQIQIFIFLTSEKISPFSLLALSITVYLMSSSLLWGMISGIAEMPPAPQHFFDLPNEPCIPEFTLCALAWPDWGLFKSSKRCNSLGLIRHLNQCCYHNASKSGRASSAVPRM